MSESLLSVSGLTMQFGGLRAIDNVDFHQETGTIVSIIGPNGAGKTTLFNCISGFYEPTEGEIHLGERRITGLPPNEIARAGIARTYQNIRLFRNMTVLENVMLGQERLLRTTWLGSIFGTRAARRETDEVVERSHAILAFVDLDASADRQADELPYGDQRRLEIARALASEPRLMMLDEPTAGMNPRETADTERLLQRLRDERNVSLLLIEHDMRFVMGISEHIMVLNYGRTIASGTPQEIRANPEVIEAYLGSSAQD